jgi:hypothetical protein
MICAIPSPTRLDEVIDIITMIATKRRTKSENKFRGDRMIDPKNIVYTNRLTTIVRAVIIKLGECSW